MSLKPKRVDFEATWSHLLETVKGVITCKHVIKSVWNDRFTYPFTDFIIPHPMKFGAGVMASPRPSGCPYVGIFAAIDINVRPAARGELKRPRSDQLSTSAARVVGKVFIVLSLQFYYSS